MKGKITLLLLVSTMCVKLLYSQSYTLDWSSSFSPAWASGAVSGNANNIGGSSVNATVTLSSPESTATSAFAGFTSPVVSSGGFPFTTQLGSNVPNLAVGMDLTTKADYVDIVIKFNNYLVSNVKFNIADIDKNNASSSTYFDEVQITGLNGAVPVTDPVLTKLVAASNYFTIAGNVASCNTTSGQGGNAASSTADQNGTVVVDFGATILTQVTIRYRNNPACQSNPAQQAIGIGNILFQKQSLLPVNLVSFTCTQQNQGLLLNWQSANELNVKEYVVEKSLDGNNFLLVDKVSSQNSTVSLKNYLYTDHATNYPVIYYRLKIVDNNGNYSYSDILLYKQRKSDTELISIYPNPVVNNIANILISPQLINKSIFIKVLGQDGKMISSQNVVPYTNLLKFSLPKYIHGIVLLQVSAAGNVMYSNKVLVN